MGSINNANGTVESAENYLNKGNTLLDQEDYESAILAYDKALDLNPDLADAYFKRGFAK